jgi:hypothetical protein
VRRWARYIVRRSLRVRPTRCRPHRWHRHERTAWA